MACGGPSYEFAEIRGEDAHQQVMKFLRDKYGVDRPDNLLNTGFGQRMQDDWDEQAKRLKEVLVELIWTSDCDSW